MVAAEANAIVLQTNPRPMLDTRGNRNEARKLSEKHVAMETSDVDSIGYDWYRHMNGGLWEVKHCYGSFIFSLARFLLDTPNRMLNSFNVMFVSAYCILLLYTALN